MFYNYEEAIKDDIREYLDEVLENKEQTDYDFSDREELEQQLYDDLFCEDRITGNGSGSYTMNSEKAREYLRGNEKLIVECMREFEGNWERALTEPEYSDVSIRCYLLGGCLYEVLDELEEEGKLIYSEDEEEVD